MVLCRLARENFKPGNFPRALIGLFDRSVEHPFASCPDIRTGAISADERNDWIVRTLDYSVVRRDFVSGRRLNILVCHSAGLRTVSLKNWKLTCQPFVT